MNRVFSGTQCSKQLVVAARERIEWPDAAALRISAPGRDLVELAQRRRWIGDCAPLRGDPSAAIDLLRKSAQRLDSASYLDEPERARFALGCLLGGDHGAAMCAAAEAALTDLGALVPIAEIHSYYPELFAGSAEKVRPSP